MSVTFQDGEEYQEFCDFRVHIESVGSLDPDEEDGYVDYGEMYVNLTADSLRNALREDLVWVYLDKKDDKFVFRVPEKKEMNYINGLNKRRLANG